jgi:hypothetical protein
MVLPALNNAVLLKCPPDVLADVFALNQWKLYTWTIFMETRRNVFVFYDRRESPFAEKLVWGYMVSVLKASLNKEAEGNCSSKWRKLRDSQLLRLQYYKFVNACAQVRKVQLQQNIANWKQRYCTCGGNIRKDNTLNETSGR